MLLRGMKDIYEKSCHCALNRIFGFKPKIGLALISHLGCASEAFRMKSRDLDELLGPYSNIKEGIRPRAVEEAEEELARLEKMGIGFIGWNEADYPFLLHECEDAPIGLYVRSTTPMEELWKPRRRIAVVGTRDISPYGKEWCGRTVSGLAASPEKPVIVSGLALGTDICAHRTALDCCLPTIAVMATGPDDVYPYRHRDFAERISCTPGCALITDYPPGTAPLAIHFLRRNRIIAGLSDATILIESKIKGGGMMTARLAFSYSREVYALPGRVDDLRSQGCNHLIKSKIAEPVTTIDGLIESLRLRNGRKNTYSSPEDLVTSAFRHSQSAETTDRLTAILKLIQSERGISIEDISSRTGFGYGTTLNLAGLLETEGFITIDILQRCCLEVGKFR